MLTVDSLIDYQLYRVEEDGKQRSLAADRVLLADDGRRHAAARLIPH